MDGLKDRDQHRHRGQRLLPPEQDSRVSSCPAGDFDLDAGGEHVVESVGAAVHRGTMPPRKFAFHVYERVVNTTCGMPGRQHRRRRPADPCGQP